MINNQFIFLYNPNKANFFLHNGGELIEIGRGKSGEVYFKFLKTEHSYEIAQKWESLNNTGLRK